MAIKYWSGTGWVELPAGGVKYWTGSGWATATAVKYWSGTGWVTLWQPSDPQQNIWNALDTQAYEQGPSVKRTDQGDNMYQGQYLSARGIHGSMMFFDYADMQSVLAGRTITRVRLRMSSDHWYNGDYSSILGYTRHGVHNTATEPATWAETYDYANGTYGHTETWYGGYAGARDQTKYIDLPIAVGEALRDGTIKGLTINPKSTSYSYYAYFHGADNGSSVRPQLIIDHDV